MNRGYNLDEISNKLSDLITREGSTIESEEKLEDRISEARSDAEVLELYEEIIEEIESEELDFKQILELEGETFQQAIVAANKEVKLRRRKLEITYELEESISRLNDICEELTDGFTEAKFEKFEDCHGTIKFELNKLDELQQNEQPNFDIESLANLVLTSEEALDRLKTLVNHLQQETDFLSKYNTEAKEKSSEVTKCRNFLQKVSNSQESLEELQDQIENIENIRSDKEKALEVYEAFKTNKSNLKELDSIINQKEFILQCYEGVSVREGEQRVNKIDEVKATVSILREHHLELSNEFNKFGAEIANLNRRDLLKISGGVAGALAGGKYGKITSDNVVNQKTNEQFSPLEPVENRSDLAIKQAIREEEIVIEVIQLHSVETDIENANYNWRSIFNDVRDSFKEELNINLKFDFHSISIDKDNLMPVEELIDATLTEDAKERKVNSIYESYDNMIKSIKTGGPTSSSSKKGEEASTGKSFKVINGVSLLRSYRRELKDSNNIKVLFSDFNMGGGVSTAYGSDVNSYIVMDRSNSEVRFANLLAHELAHKFGLPHTVTAQDVMSYSSFRKDFSQFKGRPHFSYESKFNWSKMRRKYKG